MTAADYEKRIRSSFAKQGLMRTLGVTLVNISPGAGRHQRLSDNPNWPSVSPPPIIRSVDKLITVEAVAATEAGAIAAARLMGRGDRTGADRAAVEAMRRATEEAEISGTIV